MRCFLGNGYFPLRAFHSVEHSLRALGASPKPLIFLPFRQSDANSCQAERFLCGLPQKRRGMPGSHVGTIFNSSFNVGKASRSRDRAWSFKHGVHFLGMLLLLHCAYDVFHHHNAGNSQADQGQGLYVPEELPEARSRRRGWGRWSIYSNDKSGF